MSSGPAQPSRLDTLINWFGALARWLTGVERRLVGWSEQDGGRGFFIVWLGVVVTALWLVATTGMAPIWTYLNDVIVGLDGGWRIFNGQVPGRDFYSVVGPFSTALLGSGFEWTGGQGIGLPLMMALHGSLLSAVAWYALRDRLSGFWRCVTCCWLLFLSAGAVPLGLHEGGLTPFHYSTSYAMSYNRTAWSTLSLLLLMALIPRRARADGVPAGVAGEAMLAGALFALCVFTKINFVCAACGTFVWMVLWLPGARGRFVAWSLVGMAAATAALTVYPGGVTYYFADQWTLMQVDRDESLLLVLLQKVWWNSSWLAVLGVLYAWVVVAAVVDASPTARREALRFTLNTLFAVGMGLFVTIFNFEGPQLPALVLSGVIIMELLRRSTAMVVRAERVLVSATVVLFLVGTHLLVDAGSLVYSWNWKRSAPEALPRLPGPVLSQIAAPIRHDEPRTLPEIDAILADRPNDKRYPSVVTSRQLVRWVDDGYALIRRHATPADRVFTPDWHNPFNLALDLPPATGGALHWDIKRMVDDRHHPSPEKTLREITLFMVPRVTMWQAQRDFMLGIYAPELARDFDLVEESPFWSLWRKKMPVATLAP